MYIFSRRWSVISNRTKKKFVYLKYTFKYSFVSMLEIYYWHCFKFNLGIMNEFFCFFIYLLMTLGANGSDIGCHTHATVFRELEREGFHIDIHYLIELVVDVETSLEWENCLIVLRENITSSFYVSPDQLLELNRSGISRACTSEKVDVEAPQHLARSHIVYVYGQLKRSRNLIYSRLSFPMHLRYHKPKVNGGYSAAETQFPLLLIRCPNIDCKNLQKSKAPCSDCGENLCVWTRFPYKTNNNSMTLFVPVGNLNELWFVKLLTYIITFGGCCYLLLTLILKENL